MWPTTSGPTSQPSSSTTATVEPGSGSPIEPGFTAMSTVPKLPIGRPDSPRPCGCTPVLAEEADDLRVQGLPAAAGSAQADPAHRVGPQRDHAAQQRRGRREIADA